MRKMLKDNKGSAAVEFAASSLVVISAFVMLLEASTMYFAQGVLESAVDRAARYATTGTAPTGTTREQQLLQTVVSMSLGMIDTSGVTVRTEAYGNYQQVGTPGAGTAGLGGSDNVLRIEADMDWSGLTPFLTAMIGPIRLVASAVVRAEKF